MHTAHAVNPQTMQAPNPYTTPSYLLPALQGRSNAAMELIEPPPTTQPRPTRKPGLCVSTVRFCLLLKPLHCHLAPSRARATCTPRRERLLPLPTASFPQPVCAAAVLNVCAHSSLNPLRNVRRPAASPLLPFCGLCPLTAASYTTKGAAPSMTAAGASSLPWPAATPLLFVPLTAASSA